MVKMNREQMLEYLKKFNNSDLGKYNEEQVKATVKKMEELMKQFGFTYKESFSTRCRDFSKKKDTSWFWRCEIEEHHYIEVQTGYIKEADRTYGKGRNRKTYPGGFKGLFRVNEVHVSLNPETGRPWAIGDTKTSADGCYSVTLTKRGWYSGD